MTGQTDAAAVDSNALLYQVNQNHIDPSEFTILETWGPFPIQPIVIRADMPFSLQQSVRQSLLQAHQRFSTQLISFGFHKFTEARRQDYEG
jgi:ABC-type phosphate/phosphonate transport system substrate-binding protein